MKLSELIKQLTENYELDGDRDVAIIRAGHIFNEIELYDDGITLWLEAYTEQDK